MKSAMGFVKGIYLEKLMGKKRDKIRVGKKASVKKDSKSA